MSVENILDSSERHGSGHRLARNSFYNILGQGIPLVAALFAIPFLDSGLGTARYGLLLIAWMLVGYFGLFDLGLGRALTQLVADRLGTSREVEIAGLVWTALVVTSAIGLFGMIAILLGARQLTALVASELPFHLQQDSLWAVRVLAFTIPFVVGTASLRGVLAARQRFDLINLMRVPMGVFTFAGPLIVLPFAPTLSAVMIVLLIGRAVAWVAHLVLCLREFPELLRRMAPSRDFLRPLLEFGGWMTVSNLASPIMVYMDRLVIGALLTASAVAYYATPWEVVTKLLIVPTALASVIFPSFSYWRTQDSAKVVRVFHTGLKFTALALLPACLTLILFADMLLETWLGTEYAVNGTLPMQLLTLGVLMNGLGAIPFALIQGIGRPDLTAKLHLAELPVYVVLLYWLISQMGLVGVALAWAVRVSIDFVILLTVSRYLLRGRSPELIKILVLVSVGVAVLIAAMAVDSVAVSVFALPLLCLMLLILSRRFLLNAEEMDVLRQLWIRVSRLRTAP